MKHTTLVLTLSVLFVFNAQSQWVTLGNAPSSQNTPRVTVLEDTPMSTVVKVELSGFETTALQSGGKTYNVIDLHSESSTQEVGSPEVPYVSATLAIPDQAGISVEVVDLGETYTFSGYTLPPARPSWKEGDSEPGYLEVESAYKSNAPFPNERASVEKPVVFRDFRITRVKIFPVQYVAAKKELRVASSITIRIKYGAGQAINPRNSGHRPIAPSFARLYRSSILNYQSTLDRMYGGLEAGRDVMLVITPDTYADTLKKYTEWRHKTGTYTITKKFSEIGANATDPTIVKNYILNAYNTWTYPPTHILLVGDDGYFPIQLVSYDYTFPNEDYFVELEGDDYFPEMMIGRFTHQTSTRLGIMENKFLKYEQTPYTANQDWFRKGIVCSNDAYESQISTKRFTANVMMTDGGFISVDTMMSNSSCTYDVSDVVAAMNAGRGFLNYRGEGWTDGWAASCLPFHTSDVQTINNGQMFPFVTSIGCGVAMFEAGGGNSFGEEWVEMGSQASPRGAVAFVGPTSNTHTTYNNKIDRGIYIGMFREGMESPGEALLRGKLYMYNTFGNEPWVEYHYRIYCVLGDPSIHIWKDTPKRTVVSYPSQIAVGYNQVQVTVKDSATLAPLAGIQVCLVGDTVYIVGTTDANGLALIDATPLALDTLSLVARANSIIPFQGTIQAVAAQEHVTPQGAPGVVDLDGNMDGLMNPNEHCQLSFSLKNWGALPSTGVSATLASQDTTLAQVLTSSAVSFGSIASGSTAPGASPFDVLVKPACPVGQIISFTLHVTSNSTSWDYIVNLEVVGCRLNYVSSVVNDAGELLANSRMDPGETVVLHLSINNGGEDIAPNVNAILRSSDPYVTIQDSIGSFGTIGMGSSAMNLSNYFIVAVSPSCPTNYDVNYSVVLSTAGGNYPYNVSRSISIPVGTPLASDPSGPDSYGYYAYSSDDTLYEQTPDYAWVEIDGLGTVVPGNANGDYTETVSLPFTFKYYGVSHTQVRLSSDGWIAFGSGTQTAWQNFQLPYSDGITSMAAIFWDDLFDQGVAEIGKLMYYHDAANHRFIIEWLEVGHWSEATDRETFQIILLDPAFYPTNTGNGEMLFQYKTVVEDGGNTVGIENQGENIGLQYLFNDVLNLTATGLRDSFAIKFTTELPTVASSIAQVSVGINTGWNLLSNPVLRADSLNGVLQLYPTSSFDYAFAFNPASGYVQNPSMSNGKGYWTKFGSGSMQIVIGTAIADDTVAVSAGWNIVGSVSFFVDTSNTATIPAGLRSSNFIGYSSGYSVSSYLVPGQAYWVKMTGAGQLVMQTAAVSSMAIRPPSTILSSMHTMTITDKAGHSQTLYFGAAPDGANPASMFLMPPLPPEGAFDARFESPEGGTLMRTFDSHVEGTVEFPLSLQSAEYPLQVTWEIKGAAEYELVSKSGNQPVMLGTLHGNGMLAISSSEMKVLAIRLQSDEEIPTEFALFQNYPNPFNPTTSVKFALPVQGTVTADVFNALGQKVRTLLREEKKAGFHELTWDSRGDAGQQLGSGMYFLRLDVRAANGASFSGVRKLLLLK